MYLRNSSPMAVEWRFPAAFLVTVVVLSCVGSTLSYDRPPPRQNLYLGPSDDDPTSPQQVHISLVGSDKMRISWITKDETLATVYYGTSPGAVDNSADGTTSTYRYVIYKSGQIHDVVVGPLTPDTVYYYRCGSKDARELSFKTPPAQLPIKFVVIGDLGQTDWTKSTLDHISKDPYDVLILPGDLSYADFLQPLWDNFGRLAEPLASQRPWMVTIGNHEVERIPIVHRTPFSAYNARWHMPFEESGSESNLYYSFEVAGAHVVMLGSYTDFDRDSAQYKWLEADLGKVDRGRTPWVFVIVHAPWYNSNKAHQGESESVDMKEAMEDLIFQSRVDIVFCGHVHAYERFTRVYKDKADRCGPAYITIGDGGNREGLAGKYIDPQQEISLFREASFGHGRLEVMNASHAMWTWNRNDDNGQSAADFVWFTSHSSESECRL